MAPFIIIRSLLCISPFCLQEHVVLPILRPRCLTRRSRWESWISLCTAHPGGGNFGRAPRLRPSRLRGAGQSPFPSAQRSDPLPNQTQQLAPSSEAGFDLALTPPLFYKTPKTPPGGTKLPFTCKIKKMMSLSQVTA